MFFLQSSLDASSVDDDDDEMDYSPTRPTARQLARERERQVEQRNRRFGISRKRRPSYQGGRPGPQIPSTGFQLSMIDPNSPSYIILRDLEARQEALRRYPTPHSPLHHQVQTLASEARPLSELELVWSVPRARRQHLELSENPSPPTPAGQRPPFHHWFRVASGHLHPVQEGEHPDMLPIRLRRPRTSFIPEDLLEMEMASAEVVAELKEGLDLEHVVHGYEHRDIFNDRYWLWFENEGRELVPDGDEGGQARLAGSGVLRQDGPAGGGAMGRTTRYEVAE